MIRDVARGIAAKIWCEDAHRRKIMDPNLCDSIATVIMDEVDKAKLEPSKLTTAQAREHFKETFAADPEIRKTYQANIAAIIFDDQNGDNSANLETLGDCNVLADLIIKRIFES